MLFYYSFSTAASKQAQKLQNDPPYMSAAKMIWTHYLFLMPVRWNCILCVSLYQFAVLVFVEKMAYLTDLALSLYTLSMLYIYAYEGMQIKLSVCPVSEIRIYVVIHSDRDRIFALFRIALPEPLCQLVWKIIFFFKRLPLDSLAPGKFNFLEAFPELIWSY